MGPGILRDGGVEVEFAAGEEASAARLLNQPFRKHARTGLPLVTLKLAMSLDGRTATAPGDSPWISGEQSRELVHRWRAESDAIAVGIGTVLADDPLLTARHLRCALTAISARNGASRFGSSSIARPACRSIRSCSAPSTSRRCSSSSAPGSRRFALCATPAPKSSSPTASTPRSPTSAAAASPASSSRAAEPSPPLSAADQLDEARTFVAPVLLGWDQTPLARVAWMRGGRERRRSPRPQAPPQSRRAPRAQRPVPHRRAHRRRRPDQDPLQGVVMFTGLIEDIGSDRVAREPATTARACGSRPGSPRRSRRATRSRSTASA